MSGGIVGVATPDPGTNALIQRLANPPNPLTQAGESINALANIKEFAAQNALTGIYQQSIDPTTGQVDLGKFNALASQNPAALWKFGQTMQSAGTGVGNEGQGTTAQLNARLDQLGAQAAYMTPLIAKAQARTVTADDVRSVLKDMPPGLVSPTMIANINQQLDSGANPNNVVWGAMFANEHGRATLSTTLGPGATVNQGQQVTFTRPFSPTAPGGVSSAPLPLSLTPGEVTQTNLALLQPKESWRMPDGSWHSGSVGMWMKDFDLDPSKVYYDPKAGTVSAPGAPTLTVGAPPPAAAPAPGGAEPTGRPPPPAPAPAATPAPQPAAGGPTTQGGGKPSISPKVAAAGEDAYNDANADMPHSRDRVTAAQLAIEHLKGATTGGTGTEALQAINNFLGTYPTEYLAKVIPGYDPSKAASDYQEATKYMQQLTNAAFPGGASTNDKLAAAAQATPNPHMQNRAANEVLQTGIAGELMKQHVVTAFNNSGLPPAQYQQFASQYARTHDPRAFMFPTMTPEQREYLQKTMPKGSAAAKMFNDTLHEAVVSGEIPDPMPKQGQPQGQD